MVKFDPNKLDAETLLKIRKENPAMFDMVVLGIGKEEVAAKTVVAAPVKEKRVCQIVCVSMISELAHL